MPRSATRTTLRALARQASLLMLGLVASCSTATEILEVKDPDIVNPVDVQSIAAPTPCASAPSPD
jgi:hypothetical protein